MSGNSSIGELAGGVGTAILWGLQEACHHHFYFCKAAANKTRRLVQSQRTRRKHNENMFQICDALIKWIYLVYDKINMEQYPL